MRSGSRRKRCRSRFIRQGDIRIVEGAETFDAAVKSLKFQHSKGTPRKVLRTQGFRHDSIPFGVYALTELGKRTGNV